MLIFLVIVIPFAFLLYIIIRQWLNKRFLVQRFKEGNVIVFGSKGKGKDLLFQAVVNKRKDKYFSNVNYGGSYDSFSFDLIDLAPNTYENMINNDVVKVPSKISEQEDIYISDAGVYLPSQYDTLLNKKYRSFGLAYALSRHLWLNNIHCNTQSLGRVWKLLREQADTYIRCRRSWSIFGFIITEYTIYDKYSSAENDVRAVKSRLANKYSKSEVDIYNATNGLVKNGWIIQRKRSIKYDTRIFKQKLLIAPRDTDAGASLPQGKEVIETKTN